MDISVFTNLLHSELTKIGVPEDQADRYMQTIQNNLSPADITGTTDADVIRLAKLCKAQLQKREAVKETPETVADVRSDDEDEIIIGDVIVDETEDIPESTVDAATPSPHEEPVPSNVRSKHAEVTKPHNEPVKSPTAPPRKRTSMFVLITAVSSPLWLIAAVLFSAPFIAMFVFEIAIIAALVCLLAAFAALGTAASLTGIVYGIVKMFSVPAVGLYEIGFGIIIAGVTMICGILIYNGAVRFMPWLLKKSGMLVKFVFSKVKPLLSEYKRRCENL